MYTKISELEELTVSDRYSVILGTCYVDDIEIYGCLSVYGAVDRLNEYDAKIKELQNLYSDYIDSKVLQAKVKFQNDLIEELEAQIKSISDFVYEAYEDDLSSILEPPKGDKDE